MIHVSTKFMKLYILASRSSHLQQIHDGCWFSRVTELQFTIHWSFPSGFSCVFHQHKENRLLPLGDSSSCHIKNESLTETWKVSTSEISGLCMFCTDTFIVLYQSCCPVENRQEYQTTQSRGNCQLLHWSVFHHHFTSVLKRKFHIICYAPLTNLSVLFTNTLIKHMSTQSWVVLWRAYFELLDQSVFQ